MIAVTCKACGQQSQAPDSLAGKKAACPKCHLPIVVPSSVAARSQFATGGSQPGNATNNATLSQANQTVAAESPEDDPLSGLDEFLETYNGRPEETTVRQQTTDLARLLGLAAVLSFFIPGLGQIYKRQIDRGLTILGVMAGLLATASYLFIDALSRLPFEGLEWGVLMLFIIALLVIIAAGFVWRWQLYDAARG